MPEKEPKPKFNSEFNIDDIIQEVSEDFDINHVINLVAKKIARKLLSNFPMTDNEKFFFGDNNNLKEIAAINSIKDEIYGEFDKRLISKIINDIRENEEINIKRGDIIQLIKDVVSEKALQWNL